MRKVIVALIGLLIIAAGGYSAFWFYQAGQIKKATVSALEGIKAELGDKGELSYGTISTTGFPFKLQVAIPQPKLVVYEQDQMTEVTTPGTFKLGTTIGSNLITIEAPKNLGITAEKGEKKESLTLNYQSNPKASIELKDANILSFLKGNAATDAKTFIKEHFKRFSYSDNGSNVTDEQGQVIYSQGESSIDALNNVADGKRKVDLIIKTNDAKVVALGKSKAQDELAQAMFGVYQELGTINFAVDGSIEGPENLQEIGTSEGKLSIRNLSMQSDIYGIGFSGEIIKAKEDMFPFGTLKVSLTNYKSLVDSWAKAIEISVNTTLKQTGAQEGNINKFEVKDSQKEAVKNFLKHASDEPESTGNDITITIKRDKGVMDLTVGTLNTQQATELTKKTSEEVLGKPEDRQVPGEPVAPAPGVTPNAAIVPNPGVVPPAPTTPDANKGVVPVPATPQAVVPPAPTAPNAGAIAEPSDKPAENKAASPTAPVAPGGSTAPIPAIPQSGTEMKAPAQAE